MINVKYSDDITYLFLKPDDNNQFNLLNTKTLNELIDFFETMIKSTSKVIRIYGENGSFAVGADIKTMLSYNGLTAKGFSILGNKLFNLISSLPQVVIAEIDGFCMGGGMDFASACDFRFATVKSKFSHPGAKLGIITGFGGTQRIPRLIKYRHNIEIFYTGNVFDSEFMKESGFLFETFNNKEEMNNFIKIFCKKIRNKDHILLKELKRKITS
jgi:enoyl-CoA hydratase